MSEIRIEDLSKRYGRSTWALKNVSLSISSGKVLALVGASGCGKTTLLRCIGGFERPTAGRLLLDDIEVCGDSGRWVPPEKRRVGFVFQDHALFPHLTVVSNIEFGVRAENRAARRKVAEEYLERVGLPDLGKRYPHELSGGQRRRVALARALAQRPRIVLLDEPLSGLDEPLRDALRDQVHQALRDTGSSAVWVTHRASDALAVADQVAVIHHGEVVQSGSPIELYERPDTAHIARLFGDINVLQGDTTNGVTVTALGTFATDAPSGKTMVGIRPENLVVETQPEKTTPNADASITGSVASEVFQGAQRSAHITLTDGTTVVVRLRAAQRMPPGTKTVVGVQDIPNAVRAFALA